MTILKPRLTPFTTLSLTERLVLTEKLLAVVATVASAYGCSIGRQPTVLLGKVEPKPATVIAALAMLDQYLSDAADVTGLRTALKYPEPFDQSFPLPKKT